MLVGRPNLNAIPDYRSIPPLATEHRDEAASMCAPNHFAIA
jgi:hypothetical protein